MRGLGIQDGKTEIEMQINKGGMEGRLFDDLVIAIVFYNGDNIVNKNIKTLSKACSSILIINNKSDDESQKVITEAEKNESVMIINNDENMGIGYALNQALEYAVSIKKKFLLTMDQDSIISVECVYKLLKCLDSGDEQLASVGPYYLSKCDTDSTVKYLITSGNMISVEVAKRIGGFDSSLFIDCVDLDFSFKLLAHGYRMLLVGGAYMEHKIGDIQKDSPIGIPYLGHGAERNYYNFRNNVYIYRKYIRILPGRCIKLFLSLCLKILKILFVEGNKKDKFAQSWRGIKSGFDMDISLIRGTGK